MQSVQIISSLSLVVPGPPADPAGPEGGFGLAFAEEPEVKIDPAVGGDGALPVGQPMPIWFDGAALTLGIADAKPGQTDAAQVRDVVLASGGIGDAAGAIAAAEPAAGMPTATLQTLPKGVMSAVAMPDTPATSGTATLPQAAQPAEAAGPVDGPPGTEPLVAGAKPSRPWAGASQGAVVVGQGMAEVFVQPSAFVLVAKETEVDAKPGETLGPLAARAALDASAARTSLDAPSGIPATVQAQEPAGPQAAAVPDPSLATGPHPAAVIPTDGPALVDLPQGDIPRAEESSAVAHLSLSGRETPLAGIHDAAVRRAEPALAHITAVASAPLVDIPLHPATADEAKPVAKIADAAPATGQSIPVVHTEPYSFVDQGPALVEVRPEPNPVEMAPADSAPDGDDPKRLLPGVWERLFTGILAPVLHQTVPRELPAGVPSLVGVMADAAAQGKDEAEVETVDASGHAPPSSGADPRKALVAGSLTVPAPRPFEAAFDPFSTQEIMPDPADEAFAATGGLTGPVASAPTGTGSAAALSALPVPQVAAQISAALSRLADGSTELALAPEELGKVRLKLKPDVAHPDRMVVMITFERPETLELFRKHAGDLADALRSAGYAGADIGFGQDGGTASGSDRRDHPAAQTSDTAFKSDLSGIAPPPARPVAGASLDLRL